MNTNAEDRDINQMDTNTQPELTVEGEVAIIRAYHDFINNDPRRLRGDEGIAFRAGYDAGLAARSPRDEEAVERDFLDTVARLEALQQKYDAGGYVHGGPPMRTAEWQAIKAYAAAVNASKSVKEKS